MFPEVVVVEPTCTGAVDSSPQYNFNSFVLELKVNAIKYHTLAVLAVASFTP